MMKVEERIKIFNAVDYDAWLEEYYYDEDSLAEYVSITKYVIVGISIFVLFCTIFSEIIINCSLVNC
jgi:hypothetical protein